jgi:hypothetical protein
VPVTIQILAQDSASGLSERTLVYSVNSTGSSYIVTTTSELSDTFVIAATEDTTNVSTRFPNSMNTITTILNATDVIYIEANRLDSTIIQSIENQFISFLVGRTCTAFIK